MYEQLPQELKSYPYFCGWKYEIVKGNRTKVPKNIKGHNADTRDLQEFSALDEVLKRIDDFDGLGVALAGGIAAIDIDHCIEDGKLSEMAEDIVTKADSYTEISPSGEGVRIIGKADGYVYDRERYYIHNQALGLEVYVARDKGYVTVTGNVLSDKPIRDITDVLPGILEQYMQRPVPVQTDSLVEVPGSFLTDDEVINKASRSVNGDKFISLYDGDISDYPSQSEAELAFMTMLAFWCGGDEEQMERIYLGSRLKREKWNRPDYRNSTISKALRGVTDFYKPVPVTSAEDDFTDTSFLEKPISLEGKSVPIFPVEALPKDIADYVVAVSESTQTPVDVAACASLSVLSIGIQGKYVIRPKADWREPVNTIMVP